MSCYIQIPVLNANSEDLDQTPRSAVSDLGLHCLLMSLLLDARHYWVNVPRSDRTGRRLDLYLFSL